MPRFLAFLLLGSLSLSPLADAAEPPARPSASRVQELIAQFDSENFVEREKAEQDLRELGFHHPEAVLEPLAEAWYTAASEEKSLRLYSTLFGIKHDLFYKDPIGFVGISMMGASVPVGNQRRDCILVREVVDDTAAERAKLQINDRILSVDGLAFDGLPNRTTFFSEYVRSKRPGEKIEIELVRGAEIITMDIELGERPRRYRLIWQDRLALQSEFSEFLEQQRERLGLNEAGEAAAPFPADPGRP